MPCIPIAPRWCVSPTNQAREATPEHTFRNNRYTVDGAPLPYSRLRAALETPLRYTHHVSNARRWHGHVRNVEGGKTPYVRTPLVYPQAFLCLESLSHQILRFYPAAICVWAHILSQYSCTTGTPDTLLCFGWGGWWVVCGSGVRRGVRVRCQRMHRHLFLQEFPRPTLSRLKIVSLRNTAQDI